MVRRIRLYSLIVLICAGLTVSHSGSVRAQAAAEAGDPPVAALIAISQPNDSGMVTIAGAAGAVPPASQVAIRNLYTGETVYAFAGLTGAFSIEIFGPGNTPFWISPAANIPDRLRNLPGALPGGPGTIIYGQQRESTNGTATVTQLIIDGFIADWEAYSATQLRSEVYALRNQDSLYIAANMPVPIGALVTVTLTIDGVTYDITFDPRQQIPALVREIAPTARELGTVAVQAVYNGDAPRIEARIPLDQIDGTAETATFGRLYTVTAGGEEIANIDVAAGLPPVDERDGIVYPDGPLGSPAARFSLAGPLGDGASLWTAEGRISELNLSPGESLTLEFDLTLNVPDLPQSLAGLTLTGHLGLQPVAIDTDGDGTAEQPVAALHTNNGWSNVRAATGLALDNLRGDLLLASVEIDPSQVIQQDGLLLAGLRMDVTVPASLPPGLYVPVFAGEVRVGDGDSSLWYEAGLFGDGSRLARDPLTRLPFTLNIGAVSEGRLPFALFYDANAQGGRGVMAEEDEAYFALSNRVQFNAPTLILPPGTYPLEPYVLNQLPNAYDVSTAPLVPLVLPGGRLNVSVLRPDGTQDALPGAGFVQNVLSTETLDEATRYGTRSPLDVYQLTTLNPNLTDYVMDQYGEYEITLTGTVEDMQDNAYSGGGTYRVLVAEPLDLMPGVLPGTPFHVGDAFYPGLAVLPGVAADVTVTVTRLPLDGGEPIVTDYAGQANNYGIYAPAPDDVLVFEEPGEYIIDYEARYTDPQGRLWAASLRSAGIIADPDAGLVVHGQRGLADYADPEAPAWFNTFRYPFDPNVDASPRPNYPYFAGDIAYTADGPAGGVRPVLTVQDVAGAYRDWLLGTVPGYMAPTGEDIDRLAVEGALPLLPVLGGRETPFGPALVPELIVNSAYGYISAVRPDVAVRQFVQGSTDDVLAMAWDNDDTLNQQMGAGVLGNRPDDYTFLFGGAVIRNPEAGVATTLPYAALAIVDDEDSPFGPRVYPPYRGAAGGPDGGPLLSIRGSDSSLFFHPTGARPGHVYEEGDTLTVAGQVAPTLASPVAITVTAPNGDVYRTSGIASSIGYFYDPDFDLTLDQIGVWTVNVTVRPADDTSAGEPQLPLPVGGVPGLPSGQFDVFVIDADSVGLDWTRGTDIDIEVGAGVPFNFNFAVPQGWTDVTAYRTTATAAYALEIGTLTVTGGTVSYQYGPALLNNNFPSLEFDGMGDGPSASDVVWITIAITGTNETGSPDIRARTFTVLHDRLISYDDGGGG